MAQKSPQTYENHRRLDPAYHFVAFGIFFVVLLMSVIRMIRTPSLSATWELLISLGVVIIFLKLRTYSLHNQDRIIRLEETLRMTRLLPPALQARIPELKIGQIVGLRFASDEELPTLVEQALSEALKGEAIKKRIKSWRSDTFRV